MRLHGTPFPTRFVPVLLSAVTLLVLGCVTQKAEKKDPFFEQWKLMAEQSRGHSPPSPVGSYTLTGAVDVSSPDSLAGGQEAQVLDEVEKRDTARPLPTQKVTMTMRDTEVDVILRALARAVRQNIMMTESVKGVTNINITDTPWDQVFRALLATRGLTYTWEGDIIRVMTIEDMKHELEMDKVRKERITQRMERQELEPQMTRIIPIKYADAKTMRTNLWDLLKGAVAEAGQPAADRAPDAYRVARGEARVIVDEQNNALIVHARKAEMETVIQVVQQLDRATAQIRIEANIVETTRDTARQLGVEWGGLSHGTDGGKNFWLTPGAGTGGVAGSSVDTPVNPTADEMAARFPADFLADAGKGFTVGYVGQKLGSYLLDVRLSALQREGKLNILSRPSITTLDNQMAFTESGEKIPFVSTSTLGESEVKFENAVLRLEITPHVIDKEHLKMKIVVKKDAVDITRTVQGNPFILKKQTETTLIMKDGETIVISGLTRQQDSASEDGVPGLKDMPLLGALFRGRSGSGTMEDVLVFITPHILGPATAASNNPISQKTTRPPDR